MLINAHKWSLMLRFGFWWQMYRSKDGQRWLLSCYRDWKEQTMLYSKVSCYCKFIQSQSCQGDPCSSFWCKMNMCQLLMTIDNWTQEWQCMNIYSIIQVLLRCSSHHYPACWNITFCIVGTLAFSCKGHLNLIVVCGYLFVILPSIF